MSKSIAIDLDGTIWNIMDLFIPLYNKTYNENVKIEDINKWFFFPQDRFYDIYNIIVKQINEYGYIDDMIGYYIHTLSKFYDIYFLTHGNYKKKNVKKKLSGWGIYKKTSYIDIIVDKKLRPKVKFPFDYFIDDNPCMVEEIQGFSEKELLLFTTPWNKYININGYKNVHRVDNWEEVFRFFEDKQGRVLY